MNQFGRLFQVHIFGESHGDIVGVLVDGMPCGIKVSSEDFQPDLLRRKSGGLGTTPRLEADEIQRIYDRPADFVDVSKSEYSQ